MTNFALNKCSFHCFLHLFCAIIVDLEQRKHIKTWNSCTKLKAMIEITYREGEEPKLLSHLRLDIVRFGTKADYP